MILSTETLERKTDFQDVGNKFQRSVPVWGHLDEFGEVKVKFIREPESEKYDAYLLEYIDLEEISDLRADLEAALNGDYKNTDVKSRWTYVGDVFDVKNNAI
jgi:hypothetical protein